jgi:hypothetical protein
VADYYLVAYAVAHGHTLVTHEVAAPHAIRKVKIPDVCIGLNVKTLTPYEMLRNARARSCSTVVRRLEGTRSEPPSLPTIGK